MTEPHVPGEPYEPDDPSTSPSGIPTDPRGTAAYQPGPEPARARWWRSRRLRIGVGATLAGLVLAGGGFGAGMALGSSPTPAHATHAGKAGHHQGAHPGRGQGRPAPPAPPAPGVPGVPGQPGA